MVEQSDELTALVKYVEDLLFNEGVRIPTSVAQYIDGKAKEEIAKERYASAVRQAKERLASRRTFIFPWTIHVVRRT